MDIRRIILYSALAFIVYTLWTNWQTDYPPTPTATSVSETSTTVNDTMLPVSVTAQSQEITPSSQVQDTANPALENNKTIQVKTDVLNLRIDLEHGDIIDADLLHYPLSLEEKNKPVAILQNNISERYVANSNLFTVSDHRIQNADGTYSTAENAYQLKPEQDQLVVVLKGTNASGIAIQKKFTFIKGSYLVQVSYTLVNESDRPWTGYMNTQLLRSSPPEDKSSVFHVGSYTGASFANPGHTRYQKVNFKDMAKKNLDTDVKGGWLAMQQHYFLSAWIPPAAATNRFYTRAVDNTYTIGAVSQPIQLKPSQEHTLSASLYIGPEITDVLKAISPGLDLTVDYGWLWFLSSLLLTLMKAIYTLVGNWGWAIVLVTVIIKLAFYRLSATSYKSMANMRKLQPKIQALQERYGDDKVKKSQATMELYRQEKVNPLGGCLPILIQIPVFIALYWVLLESVELRQAPFIFWIHDLSIADPYHILPIIMGITMLIQQKLNPAPPDPTQAKIMMFLPVLFTGLFWSFPAGLVLYWIVNNSLSILQQWHITRKYSDDKRTAIKHRAIAK